MHLHLSPRKKFRPAKKWLAAAKQLFGAAPQGRRQEPLRRSPDTFVGSGSGSEDSAWSTAKLLASSTTPLLARSLPASSSAASSQTAAVSDVGQQVDQAVLPLTLADGALLRSQPQQGAPAPEALAVHPTYLWQVNQIRSLAEVAQEPFRSALLAPNMVQLPFVKQGFTEGAYYLVPQNEQDHVLAVSDFIAAGSFSKVSVAAAKSDPLAQVLAARLAGEVASGASADAPRQRRRAGNGQILYAVRKTTFLPLGERAHASDLNKLKGLSMPLNVHQEIWAQAAGKNIFQPTHYYTSPDFWDDEYNVPTAIWTVSRYAAGDLDGLRPQLGCPKLIMTAWLLQLAIAASDQLADLHEAGAQHNDIKPGNVLVDPKLPSIFHLGDYGVATRSTTTPSKSWLRGTPLYFAPEIWHRESPRVTGPAVDAWALGLTLFDVATFGRRLAVGLEPSIDIAERYVDIERALPQPFSFDLTSAANVDGYMPTWLAGAPNSSTAQPASPLLAGPAQGFKAADSAARAPAKMGAALAAQQAPAAAAVGPLGAIAENSTAAGIAWLSQELPVAAALLMPLFAERLHKPQASFLRNYAQQARVWATALGWDVGLPLTGGGQSLRDFVARQVSWQVAGPALDRSQYRRQRGISDVTRMPEWSAFATAEEQAK